MKRVLMGFLALAAVQLLGGCGKNLADNISGPGVIGTGLLAVRLTDAPGAFDAVNVVVDSVRVHVDSGDSLSGWYTISTVRAEYNLLSYVNGRDTVIAAGFLPPGKYTQMRLYIGRGSTVATGGSTAPLDIPSGMQSGLKLNIQATIVADATYGLALDFDAGHSVIATGGGRYLLNPVVRVISTAVAGSLTGQVIPDSVGATVLAIGDTDTTSTVTDASGNFTFKYLNPGFYLLRCVPADTTYQDKDLPNVAVATGETTDIGAAILQIR